MVNNSGIRYYNGFNMSGTIEVTAHIKPQLGSQLVVSAQRLHNGVTRIVTARCCHRLIVDAVEACYILHRMQMAFDERYNFRGTTTQPAFHITAFQDRETKELKAQVSSSDRTTIFVAYRAHDSLTFDLCRTLVELEYAENPERLAELSSVYQVLEDVLRAWS